MARTSRGPDAPHARLEAVVRFTFDAAAGALPSFFALARLFRDRER